MKEPFEQMQVALMDFVDAVNDSHAGGIDFGTEHRLYPAEIHTVVAIGDNEGIGVTQLAKQLDVSKPTISERTRRLAAKGFIRKEKESTNAKSVLLWLTADGRTAYARHAAHHQYMYDVFCNHFGNKTPLKIELFTKAFTQAVQFVQKCNEQKL